MKERNLADQDKSLVCIIDGESSVREGLSNLLSSAGLNVQTFSSAQEFLGSPPLEAIDCLVLDVQLPGLTGLDLQAELSKRDVQIPIIFLTAHGDIPMSVRAMKAGALEFLTKPFDDEYLLEAVRSATLPSNRKRRLAVEAAQEGFEECTVTDMSSQAVLNHPKS